MLWNADGIINKFTEFSNFIYEHKIDIALVTETHTNASNRLTLANYHTYKTDRTVCRGGGTAIFVKRSYNSVQYSNSTGQHHEETSILLYQNDKTAYKFTAFYNKPGHTIRDDTIKSLIPPNIKCIIGGDLNAKNTSWGCRTNNQNGKELYKIIADNNLTVIAPTDHTYFPYVPNKRSDLLDFFITNSNTPMSCHTITELTSDHVPVIATLGDTIQDTPIMISNTNWNIFHNILALDDNDYTINDLNDIEPTIRLLTDKIQAAHSEATKVMASKKNYMALPQHLREEIGYKNYIRKRWQKNGDPKDKQELNKLTKVLKRKCQKYRNDNWNDKIAELCTENQTIWRMAKSLKSSNNRTVNKPIVDNNRNIYSDKDKLTIFANTIENQFKLNQHPTDVDEEDNINNIYDDYQKHKIPGPIDTIDQADIINIINKLNNKKAPGEDNVNNKMMKHLTINQINALCNIYNACLMHNIFPNNWKNATIILIAKPGKDSRIATNFRPISLLPTFGKILERLLLWRLIPHINFLPDQQFGFRKDLSTTKQLIRLIDFISDGLYKHETTALLMLDVAKAFDRVWHKALITKLIKQKVPNAFINIIDSYLKNRTFQIKLNDKLSDKRPINAGVPQGSILGPLLYLIYTSDFPISNDHNYMVAFYADDTAIAIRSINPNHAAQKLNENMPDIEEWCSKNKIAINTDKSKLMFIRRRKRSRQVTNKVCLFSDNIPVVNKADYLGLTLNHRLNWNDHISKIITKSQAAFASMRPLLNSSSKLPLNLKRHLYLSCIRPIFTYACPAWNCITNTQIKKLETLQNKFLRRITGAPWQIPNKYIRRDLNIETVHEYINLMSASFFHSANNTNTVNYKNIMDKELIQDSRSHNPIINFLLSDGILSHYLSHAPCFKNISTDPKKCGEKYRTIAVLSHEQKEEDKDSALKSVCCALKEFTLCQHEHALRDCGLRASQFLQRHTERMSGSLINEHCVLYTYDPGSCSSIASILSYVSINRAFCLIISFTVIFFIVNIDF
nr:uncharacterized protein LOC107438316 [Parasteatoda tepidariorum]